MSTSSSETLGRFLDDITERLIPATNGWPSARDMGVGKDVSSRLRDSELSGIERALSFLGSFEQFSMLPAKDQDEALRDLEASEPVLFALLRQILYLGYYAQPEVIRLLQSKGYDIAETPQPNGYSMSPFNSERANFKGPGVWIPTEKVRIRRESEKTHGNP